eukprot:5155990-Amphidinium_carterae.1
MNVVVTEDDIQKAKADQYKELRTQHALNDDFDGAPELQTHADNAGCVTCSSKQISLRMVVHALSICIYAHAYALKVLLHCQGADEIDFYERAKFVPMRLTYDERKYLRLIDATVHVSRYTDHMDTSAGARLNPARKLAFQMKQLCGTWNEGGTGVMSVAECEACPLTAKSVPVRCAILTGLQVAQSYEQGQQLMQSRDYGSRSPFFQTVLEIGRRYKILNPERILGGKQTTTLISHNSAMSHYTGKSTALITTGSVSVLFSSKWNMHLTNGGLCSRDSLQKVDARVLWQADVLCTRLSQNRGPATNGEELLRVCHSIQSWRSIMNDSVYPSGPRFAIDVELPHRKDRQVHRS